MANKKKIKLNFSSQAWRSYAKKVIQFLLASISNKVMHWFIVLLLFMISVGLLYINMWLPLQETPGLPPGVSPRNPQVHENLLRELHVQRAGRVQYEEKSFINADNYFEKTSE